MSGRYDVIIIGGGQAGLAMGYHLAQQGLDFLILDAGERTGDVWRKRWDSLTLFTPARYSALPGLRFPAEPDHMPHKDEVANYLEHYAQRFSLPIQHGEKVVRVQRISEWCGFVVETATKCYEADQVVMATGPFSVPLIPGFSARIGSHVLQLHSSQYRNPEQLPAGDVLVVGGGNSGVQIATELAAQRRAWLSVGTTLKALPERWLNRSLFWWLENLRMMQVTAQSRLGQKASKREFIIGKSAQELAQEHGIRLVGRTAGVEGDVVFTSDGAAIEPAAVIWATGYRQDFSWVDAPVFDQTGKPMQQRGVTPVNGLYFLGLPWMHTRGSALLGWVGRDARYLAQHITAA